MWKNANMILFAGATMATAMGLIAMGAAEPTKSTVNEPARLSCCDLGETEGATAPPKDQSKEAPTPVSPPAAGPETEKANSIEQSASVSVHGTISISDHWDLQKPDLARVVVYLASDSTLDKLPSGIDHATVSQKNKTFIPNFTVVPLNTIVEFPNWDDFDHNVFSRSKAAPAFDLDRYPKGQSKSRRFEKVGVVQVFCNIHPQMRCIIFVTPNRYFTRADAEGHFEIKDVPPGKYSIVAWQERCGDQQQPLEVASDKNQEVSFTLQENHDSVIANNPPKHEAGYGIDRGLGIKREKLNLPVVKDSHPAPPQDAPD